MLRELVQAVKARPALVQSMTGSATLQAALFASGVVMARGLGPADRGTVALLLVVPALASQAVGIGMPSAVTFFISRNRFAWPSVLRCLGFSTFLLQSVLGVLVVVILELALLEIGPTSAAGLAATAAVPVLILHIYVLHVLQGLAAFAWFNVVRVGPPVVFAVGLLANSTGSLTLFSCVALWLGSIVMGAGLGLRVVIRRAQSAQAQDSRDQPSRRTVMAFGLNGFLAQISPIETFRLDMLFVAGAFDRAVVGFYAVGGSVSNAPRFVADAISAVAFPRVAALQGAEAYRASSRYLMLTAVGCMSVAVPLVLALPLLIPALFGQEFEPAVELGQLVLVAAAVISVRRVALDCLRALGDPRAATKNELFMLGSFVACLLLFGDVENGLGVALALIASGLLGLLALVVGLYRGAQSRSPLLDCDGLAPID